MNRNVLALFDFDGTITWVDTAVPFFLYVTPKIRLITSIPSVCVYCLSAVMGNISINEAKEQIIYTFLNGMDRKTYEKKCIAFSQKLPFFIRSSAKKKIAWHVAQGHTCVIVTRSLGDYIAPWAKKNGFSKVLSTKIAMSKSKIIGHFMDGNLGGEKKVTAVKKAFGNLTKYQIYAYGNSKNDLAMLQLADVSNRFYKKMY
jgi:HAD superfamily hydrolase (TIGR01490 family)